jgi:hypothetical protein
MSQAELTRDEIIQTLIDRLSPLEYVYAMWEAGAAAFNRIDAWSDIDLMIDAEDDRTEDVFQEVEAALTDLSPIETKYELPQPAWHGHSQTFYRLGNASRFLLLDLVVLNHSNPSKFLEKEIHGHAVVLFDKVKVTDPPPFNYEDLLSILKDRIAHHTLTFDLFQILPLKELERKNWIEALNFYMSFTLRPLIELLRIKYQPARYNFFTRYIQYEFPPDIVDELHELFFIADEQDLKSKLTKAQRWFERELAEVDLDEIAEMLIS